jgi:hypothetical protein
LPTAVQAVDEGQDTPDRKVPTAPLGRATDWLSHRVPFQRSANAVSRLEPSWATPTETHCEADAHDTAVSCPLGANAGVATACIAQAGTEGDAADGPAPTEPDTSSASDPQPTRNLMCIMSVALQDGPEGDLDCDGTVLRAIGNR